MQVSKYYFGDKSKKLKMGWVCTSGGRDAIHIAFFCGALFGKPGKMM
jgi:hypothetical protein